MDNFYTTLISNNGSSNDNLPSSFRTYLPYTLQLDGQWECALAELSFMRSWNNIDTIKDEKNRHWLEFKQTTIGYRVKAYPSEEYDSKKNKEYEFLDPYKLAEFPNNNWRNFDIPGGHYTSIEDLLNIIQLGFEEDVRKFHKEVLDERKKQMYSTDVGDEAEEIYLHEFRLDSWTGWIWPVNGDSRMDDLLLTGIKITYDEIRKRVIVTVNPAYTEHVMFSKHLEFVLGFKQTLSFFSSETVVAEYPVNLNAGANSLYVYTDVIQPNIVSDNMARLLRIVNAEGEYGKLFTKAFSKPYYLPVSSSVINGIEIEIKDEMNRLIRFSFGITIALLHFQRRKSINLV